VARCLEDLGHEVVVADPNYAPMYATRSRRVKTDRRDAQALMDACRLGAYRPAHRTSETQRRVRALLTARDNLVRTRIREIQVMRALLRREGIRVRSGQTSSFAKRMAEQDLPEWLGGTVAPIVKVMDEVNRQLEAMDQTLQRIVGDDPVVRRLCTAPGIGPVTAIAFVSTIDRVERFDGAHQVASYLGLVPREFSSGERQQRGSVTKAGNGRLRWLLVEAAWSILRSRRSSTEQLRQWTERIALRRGRRIAVVALARRLAGVLYAMWRDETEFGRGARRSEQMPKVARMA
jgi:transposase